MKSLCFSQLESRERKKLRINDVTARHRRKLIAPRKCMPFSIKIFICSSARLIRTKKWATFCSIVKSILMAIFSLNLTPQIAIQRLFLPKMHVNSQFSDKHWPSERNNSSAKVWTRSARSVRAALQPEVSHSDRQSGRDTLWWSSNRSNWQESGNETKY